MRRRMALVAANVGALVAATFAALALMSGVASAHPLGNFTVNQYDGIIVGGSQIRVQHVEDLAEIPTVQAMPTIDANNDRSAEPAELSRYAATRCTAATAGITISLGDARPALVVDSAAAEFRPGQAGLQTLRVSCELSAPATVNGRQSLDFTDVTIASDIGWREVTLQGDEVTVSGSSVPTTSVSDELRSYPVDMQSSPLQVRTATAQVQPGGPALITTSGSSTPAGSGTPWQRSAALLTSASSSAKSPFAMAVAVLIALAVGAFHAMSPGHGKSIVAFGVAGRRERALRGAIAVGATVTLTHTASVLTLGILVASTASFAPVTVYPALNLVTAVVVLVVGLVLLRNAYRRRSLGHHHPSHDHDHDHGHSHGHSHDHSHDYGHSHDHAQPHPHESAEEGAVASGGVAVMPIHDEMPAALPDSALLPAQLPGSRRGVLVGLGVVGGLLPSPSAVVVLLGAAAAGRAWFGVVLVVAFGAGMALTLAGVAIAVLRGQDRLLALAGSRPLVSGPFSLVSRAVSWLPLLTAGAVVAVGMTLIARAAL